MELKTLKESLNNAIRNNSIVYFISNCPVVGKIESAFNGSNMTYIILSRKFLIIFEPHNFKRVYNINNLEIRK